MRYPIEELKRWLKQAKHDLEAAKIDLKNRFFADACYSAEQAAQKALKGYLYFRGSPLVWKHSIKELVTECTGYDHTFAELSESGKILDQYYIPTRYPDVLAPPAVPFESYTQTQAAEAAELAEKILAQVESATN
jgi:HEPN domain-containing protein